MRKELETYDWRFFNLGKSDIAYMVSVVEEIIEDRKRILDVDIAEICKKHPENGEDVWDDISFYKNLECFYLWEFLIIRIIGIFEGLIEKEFLPPKEYRGYADRLVALKKNYILKNEGDIQKWVKLRNALAHSPTEKYHPALINRDDIEELCALLFDSIDDLRAQKKQGIGLNL